MATFWPKVPGAPPSGSAFLVSSDLGAASTLSFSGMSFDDADVAGVQLTGAAVLTTLSISDSSFTGNYRNGVDVTSATLDSASITDTTFTDNGGRDTGDPAQTSSGDGDILFFQYGGDATLQNLTISGGGQGIAPAENAIQFRGDAIAMGDVVLDTVGWTGLYSGRKTFPFVDGAAALADRRLRYLVVEQHEMQYDSDRCRTLRWLIGSASEPVVVFPRSSVRRPKHRTVAIYRWHPDRFRRHVATGFSPPVPMQMSSGIATP